MIKEALEYLVKLGNTRLHEVGAQTFSSEPLYLIDEPTVDSINVQSLSGLIEYVRSNIDDLTSDDARVLIHIVNPTTVRLFSQLNTDAKRNLFIQADANLPKFSFNNFYDAELFNIKLQSAFVDSEDRQNVIDCCSSITEENVQTASDDGTKQIVTARVGIAELGKAEVPNPVLLRPYRTFTEVAQPFSKFVFRLKNGPSCALFEADGGAWELEAMRNVQHYIAEHLSELVESGKVVIIA